MLNGLKYGEENIIIISYNRLYTQTKHQQMYQRPVATPERARGNFLSERENRQFKCQS